MTETMKPVFDIKNDTQNEMKVSKVCQSCNKIDEQLLRCSKCKIVYYCGIQCQKADWPNHKKLCGKENAIDTKPKVNQQSKENPKVKKQKEEGLNQFGKLTHVGTGNFSIIYKTNSKKDGKTYAIKQIQKSKVQRMRKQADVIMEKHCLTKLKDCPHVVRLYKTFQDELSLYFQLQFPVNGELWQISKVFGIIPNALYKYYITNVVKAVSVLHNQYQIVHRDLKPENILIDGENKIKLIDFGTAKDLQRPDIKGAGNGLKGKKQFENYVGTAHYMAPECIHNRASQKKSDIYSLSGIFYFLKVGSPPFQGGSQYLTFTKSLQNQLLACPQLFDQNLRDLIKKMNCKEMDKRIDINQVMAHPYFEGTDFSNLETYEQCIQNISENEKYLVELSKKLCTILQSEKEPSVGRRKQIYQKQIKPIIDSQTSKFTTDNLQMKTRFWIIDIQCQTFLNIRDNTNISFTEIYQQLKGTTKKKAEELLSKHKEEQKNQKLEEQQLGQKSDNQSQTEKQQ